MDLPRSAAAARDMASLLHPYTNLPRHDIAGPLVITEGRGVRVFDEHGKSYIEGMAGLWCTTLGWGEDRLAEAASRQMKKLAFYHPFSSKSHEPAIDLASALLAMAPAPMGRVFFANSGSEANDTAIKLVWYLNNALGRPEKKKLISRQRGYHGVTVATASLTALPFNQMGFDLPIDRVLHTDCPHYWRYGEDGETEEDFATRMAESLEDLIVAEGPETVAAFFAEPVMGAGGVIPPPATYFEKIQAVLKKYDVLLIVDEVICGFGRTGRMFGSETYGIRPDMMTLAKGLSSGYLPISALLISDEIYRPIAEQSGKIGVFGHGYTYGGHPVSCAVALEAMAIYQDRDILGHVATVAPLFQKRLAAFADHPLVGEARGVGMIGAVELVRNKTTKRSFAPKTGIAAQAVARAQEHGVILRAMGEAVAFSPPLVITEAEIDEMFSKFGVALDEVLAWAKAEGRI